MCEMSSIRLSGCLDWLLLSSKHALKDALGEICDVFTMLITLVTDQLCCSKTRKERVPHTVTIYSTITFSDSPERTVEIQSKGIMKEGHERQLRWMSTGDGFQDVNIFKEVTFDAIKCSSNYTTMPSFKKMTIKLNINHTGSPEALN